MAVTTDNIRDLLNRPRGLNDATVTELITVRTNEVNKVARGSLYSVGDHVVTTDLKEGAIKMPHLAEALSLDNAEGGGRVSKDMAAKLHSKILER